MRYGDIDIPEPVIEALADGQLALIAGAGVSVDPPAKYPDFGQLAREAAGVFKVAYRDHEPFDQFFGRLDRAYPDRVHSWVRDRLSQDSSAPNPHHTALLRLFRRHDCIRIVTTNFDTHFSASLSKAFPADATVEEYRAPALPVGSRFAGLVYLHGSVAGPADRLVLTDSDFGRAYLTEGWACRFLLDLFRTYTVLFVGYSGQDTVVRYLARGLPPDSVKVFAFSATDDESNQWNELHIKPVVYHSQPDDPPFASLWLALERIADDAHRNALDHERRARDLLRGPPPLTNSEENDYLVRLLSNLTGAAFFIRYAQEWQWVRWAEREDLLRKLFDTQAVADGLHLRLAGWLATLMAKTSGNEPAGLLARHGCHLSPALWMRLLQQIGDHGDLGTPEVRTLLGLLLCRPPAAATDDQLLLYGLVQRLPPEPSPDLCMLLFQFLTTPVMTVREWRSGSEGDGNPPEIDRGAKYYGDGYALETLWKGSLHPRLPLYAARLAVASGGAISLHRHFWNLWQVQIADWDRLTIARPDVVSARQCGRNGVLDTVVNIAVECIEWLQDHEPEYAQSLVRTWLDAEPPTLQKLAVNALACRPDRSADDMLTLVLSRDWLERFTLRAELTRLIQKVYPEATPGRRLAFLDRARTRFEEQEHALADKEGHAEWQMFWLLACLTAAGGTTCPVVSERLGELRSKHPGWQYRPELSGRGRIVDVKSLGSPVSAADLLSVSPDQHLNLLLSYDAPPGVDAPPRANLLDQLRQAVSRNPAWGLEFAHMLARLRDAPDDLWHVLASGFREATLGEEQWRSLLCLLGRADPPLSTLAQLGFVILHRLEAKEGRIPGSLHAEALTVCRRFWELAADGARPPFVGLHGQADAATAAINHIGGIVVQVALATGLARRQAGPEACGKLPCDVAELLALALTDPGARGRHGRVVLAAHVAYFHFLDPEWTVHNVVPLFCWQEGQAEEARRAWEGHGILGRLVREALPVLFPLYRDAMVHWRDLAKDAREGLCQKSIGLLSSTHLTLEQRREIAGTLVSSAGAVCRLDFAGHVALFLRDVGEEERRENWEAWTRLYLEGLPRAPKPSADEVWALLRWAPYVPDFPGFVRCISSLHIPLQATEGWVFGEILRHGVADRYPAETVELARWALAHSCHGVIVTEFEKLAGHLANASSRPKGFEAFLDALCAKGSQAALPLREAVMSRQGGPVQ